MFTICYLSNHLNTIYFIYHFLIYLLRLIIHKIQMLFEVLIKLYLIDSYLYMIKFNYKLIQMFMIKYFISNN